MNHLASWLCLLCVVTTPAAAGQSGENVALGKAYTLSPPPNYSHCTGTGNATQLTDGRTTEGHFWTQPGTVGWARAQHVAITIDLGAVEPIEGVSFRTAAGAADVGWPATIRILTSEDGQNYRDQGDLAALDRKQQGAWPEGYAVRRLATSGLHARGRFVRFLVLPRQYAFCDEIEIFRGSPASLQGEPGGAPVADVERLAERWRMQAGIQRRFDNDIAAVGKAIEKAEIADRAIVDVLRHQWTQAGEALLASAVTTDSAFRAVLPYNEAHARLFQVQAALWKAQGRTDFSFGVPNAWDSMEVVAMPPLGGRIEVHTMRGEYRAAAVNLMNATATPIDAKLSFEGLPETPAPAFVTVHESPWTDTMEGRAVVAALPLAKREGSAWRVSVLPGLVRQVWLTFHVEHLPPGEYAGNLVVDRSQGEPLRVPIRLQVYPLDFPRQTTLQVGGWSCSDGPGAYAITPRNRGALLAHLRDHFVNAPWATAAVMMSCSFDADGAVKLDTKRMDDWLAEWPRAKNYYVFLACGDYGSLRGPADFGGAKPGTAEFQRNVGAWISAWVRHLGGKGIAPEQLGLLIHDEPHEGTKLDAFFAWATAIRMAEPKVRVWEDPCYGDPTKAPAEFFEACDVLCPNRSIWLERDAAFTSFYREQQQKGRTLQLYSCSGPARLLDPYSYYRLQAWHCHQIGATGSFFWAFGDTRGASSWNEYLVAAGPFCPLFLDDSTVTSGKQMEAIREGVEDYETFAMLRAAVEKAKAAGRHDAVVLEAESLLANAAAEVLGLPGAGAPRWHTEKDRTKADAVRVRILQALSALVP